ncbi:UDP-N-acetylmuramoyl-L-alanyl-D-glutamate--2,6-diaminopimelate ligase, partial [Candidatus Kaiserbacteria bacterium]|nr:UDP-N-acetylmuramoyl-L-alanyl-D-glutamate--2,6-diaminopimelate ligase [Candidatus Kaiserbacteria bacterium]
GAIAERFCDEIILTNEDPYDEDPEKIITDMKKGMSDTAPLTVIMDRREAIKTAFEKAVENSCVLISGKGTDPYIMGPNGTKTPWSDAQVVQELLADLADSKTTAESSLP